MKLIIEVQYGDDCSYSGEYTCAVEGESEEEVFMELFDLAEKTKSDYLAANEEFYRTKVFVSRSPYFKYKGHEFDSLDLLKDNQIEFKVYTLVNYWQSRL